MTQLVVRNLEEGVKEGLRARAVRRGHSMEEEVREVLRAAAVQEDVGGGGLGTEISRRFAGLGFGELESLRQVARGAVFEE